MKTSAPDFGQDDSAAAIGGVINSLSPEGLEKNPLRKGDILIHAALGAVTYLGKATRKPRFARVSRINTFDQTATTVIVHLDECRRDPKAKQKAPQKTRLILCVCPKCELRIRVSQLWLNAGAPRCWNLECETYSRKRGAGGYLEAQFGADEENPGKLGIDRAERIRESNHATYGSHSKQKSAAEESGISDEDFFNNLEKGN